MAVAALALLAAAALAMLVYARRPEPAGAYRTSVLLPEGLRFPGGGTVGGVGRFAISPDGSRIVFVATDANGNRMLWLRPLDTLGATPLPGTDGASSPFWAPDSRRLAFVARGQLKTLDVAGGLPAVIATSAFGTAGAWNADDIILFTPTASSPLHAISASGGVSTPVTMLDPDHGDVIHRSPVFLPGGRRFLYVAVSERPGGTTGPRAVYAASLDSGQAPVLVMEGESNARYSQQHLIFVRDNRLMAQPFDVDRLELTGGPKPLADQVELLGPASTAFSVSDTGVLAYQPSSGPGSQLVWFDREGRQLGAVGEPSNYGDVELSPDGRQAAVSVLDAVTNTRDIWILDVERGTRSRLTFDAADDIVPCWSPDGSTIIFTSNRTGRFDLYRKPANGVGAEEVLFADGSDKYPTSWAPDGLSLLFWRFDPVAGATSIWTLGLSGGEEATQFLPSPVSPGRLSPDGKWVTYYSAESGRSEVYVVPYPEASARWQVSTAGGTLARWSHDSQEIIYASRDNKLVAVSIGHGDGQLTIGTPREMFEARPVGPRSFFDLAPDGRILMNVFRGERLSSSIAIVQHWAAALQP